MKKIKVAFLEYSDIFAGAEMSLHSLIKYLDSTKFESIICFLHPQVHQERYNDLHCKKYFLANEKKWWMGSDRWKKPIRGSDFLKRFIFAFKLVLMVKRRKIDIIHINLIRPDSLLYVWLPYLFDIKVIIHSRSDLMSWIPSASLQKKCDAIICVSNFVKDMVQIKYPSSIAYTVYDPVDYDQYSKSMTKEQALQNLKLTTKQKLLASVGLLSSHKGHDMAICVFARIVKEFPDYILMIAGGGDTNELKRLKHLAMEKAVEKRVIFTEKQIANIDTVYYAADIIFSLTTRGEAFGRIPFEGNACDVTVIAPAKGAALELITDNETGFLVDPLDEEAIVAKVLYILEHAEETKKIVANGKRYFKQELSPVHSAKEVEKIYFKILKKNI